MSQYMKDVKLNKWNEILSNSSKYKIKKNLNLFSQNEFKNQIKKKIIF